MHIHHSTSKVKDTKEQIKIAEVLALYLLGKVSKEQQKQIESWLAEDKEHFTLLEELQRVENTKHREVFIASIDEGENWKKFVRKAGQRPKFYKLFKYVAILLPILFGGYWLFQNEITRQLQVAENLQKIAPGEKKAQLRLESGETIVLSGIDTLLVGEDNGVCIENKDKTLNYIGNKTVEKQRDIVFHELFVAKGQEYHMILADGTEVWLNSDSYLKYPVNFIGDTRKVILSGEAYFEVAHNAEIPFIVHLQNDIKVEVTGTAFNIRNYEDEEELEVVLEKGGVNLHYKELEFVSLSPGMLASYNAKEETVKQENVNTSLYTAWRKGEFIFESAPLDEIMHTLARWYDVKIDFEEERIKKIRFSGSIKRYETINTFLQALESAKGLKFSIDGNTIHLMRNTTL